MSKAVQNWKMEVLFLAGLSVRQVAREVLADEELVGRVHRLIRSKKLTDVRQGDRRAAELLRLEQLEPSDHRGFVAQAVTALAIEAGRVLAAERRHRSLDLARDRNRVELVTRKGLPGEMERLRGVPAEPPRIIKSTRPKSDLIYNDANCTLSWMGARGWLPEWAISAGVALRRDFHAVGGAVRAIDYSKPKVDGGRPNGFTDASLDAADRRERALVAIRIIFQEDNLHARLALLDHVAVQDRHLRELMNMPAHLARRRATTLAETLEPVAWAYGYCLDGDVAKRLERVQRAEVAA